MKSFWESTGLYFTFTMILTRGSSRLLDTTHSGQEPSCYFLVPPTLQPVSAWVGSLVHPYPHPPRVTLV